MEKQFIIIEEEHITLGQLLKLTNEFNSGGEIKHFLKQEGVFVNDEKEYRRGRKLFDDDVIQLNGKQYIVVERIENDLGDTE